MEETSPRVVPIGPAAALALAAAAVALFLVGDRIGFLGESAEPLFLLTSILGWVLLAWSVIVAGVSLAALVARAVAGRFVSRSAVALLGACVALDLLAVWLRPLWGSGSGSGG